MTKEINYKKKKDVINNSCWKSGHEKNKSRKVITKNHASKNCSVFSHDPLLSRNISIMTRSVSSCAFC